MVDERVAGDRGLAFVLIGLIALGVLWRVHVVSPRARAQSQAPLESGPVTAKNPTPKRNFERTIRSDYRKFHEQVGRLSGNQPSLDPTPILEDSAPDFDSVPDEKR